MSKRLWMVWLLALTTIACSLGSLPTATSPPTPSETDTPAEPATPLPTPVVEATPVPPATTEAPPPAPTAPAATLAPTSAPLPTATPLAPPTILSFTADKESIVEGEEITFFWEATGGTGVTLNWSGKDAILRGAPQPLDPNHGSATIRPDGRGDFLLIVSNSAGEAQATLHVDIRCAHDWVPELAANPPLHVACPQEAQIGPAAQQPFEHGLMIWIGPTQEIYVLYDRPANGHTYPSFRMYPDNFHEGDPESDPNLVPPPGLYQPIRGFGLVWRTYPEVREGLGWATAPEQGFNGWKQEAAGGGMHNSFTMLKGLDGTIYQLIHMDSSWSVYLP